MWNVHARKSLRCLARSDFCAQGKPITQHQLNRPHFLWLRSFQTLICQHTQTNTWQTACIHVSCFSSSCPRSIDFIDHSKLLSFLFLWHFFLCVTQITLYYRTEQCIYFHYYSPCNIKVWQIPIKCKHGWKTEVKHLEHRSCICHYMQQSSLSWVCEER